MQEFSFEEFDWEHIDFTNSIDLLLSEKGKKNLSAKELDAIREIKDIVDAGEKVSDRKKDIVDQLAAKVRVSVESNLSDMRGALTSRSHMLECLTQERFEAILASLTPEIIDKVYLPVRNRSSFRVDADVFLEKYFENVTAETMKARYQFLIDTVDDFNKATWIEKLQYLTIIYFLDEAHKMATKDE